METSNSDPSGRDEACDKHNSHMANFTDIWGLYGTNHDVLRQTKRYNEPKDR